jgi:hypothetical protein
MRFLRISFFVILSEVKDLDSSVASLPQNDNSFLEGQFFPRGSYG